MKRPRSPYAAIVRLNVGGRAFDTTRDTLSACGFFAPYLEGRMAHAVDRDGRLFIDRSPELFAHLLQWLRAGTAPSQRETRRLKHRLLAEAGFFDVPHLSCFLRGETSAHDLRPEDRVLKTSEMEATENPSSYRLVDVFEAEITPKIPLDLQVTLFPRASMARPALQGGLEEFQRRFEAYTGGGLMQRLEPVANKFVIAGGAVTAALTNTEHGDVDIFLLCKLDEARGVLEHIYSAVAELHQQRHGASARLLVTRSKYAITLFQAALGQTHRSTPLQIITSVYESVAQLLLGFDVDAACFAYLPHEKKVVGTARGVRSLRFGANIFDSAFDSATYVRRLQKYDARGFSIGVPGFDLERVSRRLMAAPHLYLEKYDLLLRPAMQPELLGKDSYASLLTFAGRTREQRQVLDGATVQLCEIVRGFERLVVTKYGKVRRSSDGDGKTSCMPLRVEGSRCTVAWGDEPVEDMEGYSASPYATARALLEDNAEHEAELCEGPNEFEWRKGGAMDKLTNKPLKQAFRVAQQSSATRLHTNSPLMYVYDLVPADTPFASLKYVLDAGRTPLEACGSSVSFLDKYGLDRTLDFRVAGPRVPKRQDLWSVYE